MIVKGYIFSILYVLICVAGALLLHKIGVPKKYTRKFVHIFVGFEWVILNHFFGPSIHFTMVCILFTILLAADYKMKLVPAMSSDGDNAPGTVYYAVAMTVLSIVSLFEPRIMLPFGIAVFCTSFGDGLAGVLGQAVKKHNPKVYGSKSIVGTLTNFFVCFFVPFAFGYFYDYPIELWHCLIIAIFAAEIELFVSKGLDNIVITLSVALLAFSLVFYPVINSGLLAVMLTPVIIALAYSKKAMTLGGIVLAVIMDIIITVSLGNFGFCVLITFFTGSVIVDKIKKRGKKAKQKEIEPIEKRGDCRDVVQVFANGGVAMIAAIAYLISGEMVFVFAFCASLAEAFADTAASGLGFFAKRTYDVFRLKKCEGGLSGGMSLLGTFSSLAASAVISLVVLLFGVVDAAGFAIIFVSGFLGSVFDSMLGSLLQVKYRCTVCKSIVEREVHCGAKTEKYRGLSFISNDTVNLFSTFFAAAMAVVIFVLI
ncbi:MAG: DUF92 domain-containing protein [Clostridia bacterium]|nr:DUF92 domain-containing protein [Clostridia bacterium]